MSFCLWRRLVLSIVIIFNGAICYASEEMLLIRYHYGSLVWDGARHEKPDIVPYFFFSDATRINDVNYPRFTIGDVESNASQEEYKLSVKLDVKKKDKYLQAHVVIKNKSTTPYYVHRYMLAEKGSIYPLCGNVFSIVADGIILRYLKIECHYDRDDEWQKIPAGGSFAYSVNLNEAYAFPSGYRRYNIGSHTYQVVTENWFQEQNINEAMFSILDWEYHCKIEKNVSYIESGGAVCDLDKKSFSTFIYLTGLKSERSGNKFYIRTNQVTIYLDGDTLQPFNYNQY
ncbi:hypothetical protein KXR87_17275 [Yokenella regensburgei]|uniref:hypothetical protein n=1 Tax=Yokenella regensburgei TaxID=158877 RepID=UPI003F14E66E